MLHILCNLYWQHEDHKCNWIKVTAKQYFANSGYHSYQEHNDSVCGYAASVSGA